MQRTAAKILFSYLEYRYSVKHDMQALNLFGWGTGKEKACWASPIVFGAGDEVILTAKGEIRIPTDSMSVAYRIWRFIGFAGLLWGMLLLGGACSVSDSPPLSKLPADGIILAFGDSLTQGMGAGGEQYSYPSILAKRINRPVINAGVPGELSHEGLARLASELDQHQPHLVILCHGGNDLLRQRNDNQIAANLRKMIELIQARGIEVILLGVPKPAVFFMDAADFYTKIAEEYQIPFDDQTLLRLEKDPAFKSDQIHLNREGYRLLAEAVIQLLRNSGAL